MQISISDLLEHSFVISINNNQYQNFKKIFIANNLTPVPKQIYGIRLPLNNQLKSTKISEYLKKHISAMTTHRMIISMAAALNWPFVCIFEDDAVPRIDIQNKLTEILSDIPDITDILILGNIHTFEIKNYNEKYVIPLKTWGLQSYIVFQKNYTYFLNHIDINTQEGLSFYGHNCFLVKKQLFVQYQTQKSISGIHGFYHYNYSLEFLNREFKPSLDISI